MHYGLAAHLSGSALVVAMRSGERFCEAGKLPVPLHSLHIHRSCL